MPNLDQPETVAVPDPTVPQPGQVVLTTQQYNDLQQRAAAAGGQAPATPQVVVVKEVDNVRSIGTYVGLAAAAMLVLVIFVPGVNYLAFSIFILGAVGAIDLFRHRSTTRVNAQGKPQSMAKDIGLTVFRVIAAITLGAVFCMVGFYLFIIFLFSLPGQRGS